MSASSQSNFGMLPPSTNAGSNVEMDGSGLQFILDQQTLDLLNGSGGMPHIPAGGTGVDYPGAETQAAGTIHVPMSGPVSAHMSAVSTPTGAASAAQATAAPTTVAAPCAAGDAYVRRASISGMAASLLQHQPAGSLVTPSSAASALNLAALGIQLPAGMGYLPPGETAAPPNTPVTPFSTSGSETPLPGTTPAAGRRWPMWRHVSEEEFKAKNEKRLLHNRISAKVARERKKAFIAALTEQVAALETKKLQLETMVGMLTAENERLRAEVTAAARTGPTAAPAGTAAAAATGSEASADFMLCTPADSAAGSAVHDGAAGTPYQHQTHFGG